MNILINGDIYIKIKASIFNPSRKVFEILENELYDLDFEESKYGTTQYTNNMRQTLDIIEGVLGKKGEKDYSYLENFFILSTDGQNVVMKTYMTEIDKEILKTFSINSEQMTEYKRLAEFLEEAEFVGRKMKIYDGHLFENPIVLYKTDYAMCVLDPKTENVEMLDIRLMNTELGEKDEIAEQYRDKQLLYKKIMSQLVDLSKKYEQDDEHRKHR